MVGKAKNLLLSDFLVKLYNYVHVGVHVIGYLPSLDPSSIKNTIW